MSAVLPGQKPQGQSIADASPVDLTLTHQRRLAVAVPPDTWYYPTGRIVYRDDFEAAPLLWTQNLGAVARDTTTARAGGACMKLTTGAVAGNQAIARKLFMLPADQGYQLSRPIANRTARIIIGCWFRQADAFLREFHLRLFIDDTVRTREFWVQFNRRNVGIDANNLNFLNSAGGASTVTTYPIDNAVAVDVWNWVSMELDYANGVDPAGYGSYRSLRISDVRSQFTAGASACLQGATTGLRQSTVDIVATTDSANACSVFVDDFMYTDLSGDFL